MIILYRSRICTWHVVQPGESLYKLANQYKITAQAIVLANPQIEPNVLYSGQNIRIPVFPPYNQISIYQEQFDIPAPEELYAEVKTDDADRGVMEVITDLFGWYSELYDKFMTTLTQTKELQAKIAEYSDIVSSYMITPTQNLSIDTLLNTQKEIKVLAEEALKIHEANKGLVFFNSIIAPIIDKFFNYIPIVNEMIYWVLKMIDVIESGETDKISEVLNQSTELLNDISAKIAEKYASMGAEEEIKKMEEKLKELEKWKQDVTNAYEKHKAGYMAECEELKIKYSKLLEECKAIEPAEPETPEIPTSPEKPEDSLKIIGSTTVTGNYPSESTFWAYFSFAVDLDLYNNGIIQDNLRVHFYNESMWKQITITIKFGPLERRESDPGYSRVYIPSSFSWDGINIYDRHDFGEARSLTKSIKYLNSDLNYEVDIRMAHEILEYKHP